ncbi:MAG: NAD(P)/FAD-dependent oxidoreductase [bacterium]
MSGQTKSRGKILYHWPNGGCVESLRFTGAEQLRPGAYDVVIIGAGVVGCALAFRLSQFQLRILLIDKNYDVGEGTSKGNSAILHTGFDASPGTLESQLVTQASREWPGWVEKLKIPFEQTGAVLIAIDDEQQRSLRDIHKKSLANGVDDVEELSASEVRTLEPNATKEVRGGLLVPRESIADPFTTSVAFAEVALTNGVDILLGVSITGVEDTAGPLKKLVTQNGDRISTRFLINAAGLGGRALTDCYGGTPFDINPRRGQFLIFDPYCRNMVERIFLPVPTPQTKGVLVIPTIFGNLLAGPTAEDLPLDSQEATSTTLDGLQAVLSGASRLFPGIAGQPAIGAYSGARCNCAQGSYQIRYNDGGNGIVTVAGIRSTGFSASLALADYLIDGLNSRCGLALERDTLAIDERAENCWPGWWRQSSGLNRPNDRRMVCYCQEVTCGDIVDTLNSPLRPHTLDAIKRRTRAQMGRCQGFHCQIRLAEIISEQCEIPLNRVTKRGPGSELV